MAVSWVFSKCIQRIAKSEVNGRDAIKAPNRELRLAISLTRVIVRAEIPILMM
jgi:hypothetical protein